MIIKIGNKKVIVRKKEQKFMKERQVKHIQKFMKEFSKFSDNQIKAILDETSAYIWPEEFGKRPLLFDHLCMYTSHITFKKRLHYLFIAIWPVAKSSYFDDRRWALKILARNRKIKLENHYPSFY